MPHSRLGCAGTSSSSGVSFSCSESFSVDSFRGEGSGQALTFNVCSPKKGNAVYQLAVAQDNGRLTAGHLLVNRPVALLSLVPSNSVLFFAGAVAGVIGKTLTAPLDRVKILLQVKGGLQGGAVAEAAKSGKLLQALIAIGKEEGIRGYWKGNTPQILRVIPYSAVQLCSYEFFKVYFRTNENFQDKDGKLSIPARLIAGGCAGMAATLATYPLDTLRLRLAVDPKSLTLLGASRALFLEGGKSAFFRGLGASLLGIAPYMALELGVFDLLPQETPSFVRGFTSALIATTVCYPLDTIRRRLQLCSAGAVPFGAVVRDILAKEGIPGFYRGFVPNAFKNLPNKGVRLATFDAAKTLLVTSREAYEEERAAAKARGTVELCRA